MSPAQGDQRADHPSYLSFSAGDWWYHSHAHADFQLAISLSRTRNVLIVNSMGLRAPSLSAKGGGARIVRKLKSMARSLRVVQPGLAVLSPVFLPVYGTGRMAALNNRLVAAQVRIAMRRLRHGGAAHPRPHCIVSNPTALPVAELVPTLDITFYRVDHFSSATDIDTALIRGLEDRAFARADHVLYSSEPLRQEEVARHGGRGAYFSHGVDLELFDPGSPACATEPADLVGIAHPRIAVIGSLEVDDRRRQIADLAAALPELQFVVVGSSVTEDTELSALTNVHGLGLKDHAEVPAYMRHCDVGLLTVPRTEWGWFANPIKLKEYLAMGLPVVCNRFAAAEEFRDVIEVAADEADLAARLRAAAAVPRGDGAEQRRRRVLPESWAARAATLQAMLGDTSPAAGPAGDEVLP